LSKQEKLLKRKDAKSIETFKPKDCYRAELCRALYKEAPTRLLLTFGKTLTVFTKKYFLISWEESFR